MSKFKVGDRVVATKGYGRRLTKGQVYIIEDIKEPYYRVRGDDGAVDGWEGVYWAPELAGPVRAVTRREIVPGTYGVVRIKNGRNGNAVDVWMDGSPSTGFAHWYTADELDAAARTLQQLAEALRDD